VRTFILSLAVGLMAALSHVAQAPKAAQTEEAAGTPPPIRAATPEILTPPAPATPRINGPRVYAARPGAPFLYRIPATGLWPITFAADGLPAGLALDPVSGIITGRVPVANTYPATLVARNARGESRRDLRIVIGDRLALTPPMGWNSWYIHYHRVSDGTMRAAADAMVTSGMADYGYQYVNIDDCWPRKPGSTDPELSGPRRDDEGRILPNARFPDMKALTGYIHSKGLKAGIYISPGPLTCADYEGSYGHEALDARTFAAWGFDFLKYDWCSYAKVAGGTTVADLKRPYELMWGELRKQDRDIVLNLCQYGKGEVWKWGAEVGHSWRTTDDLGWLGGALSKGIFAVGLFNVTLADYAGPGHWNDPDYLLIGRVGDARKMGEGRPTTLTPDEQYTHMSMWALMAAPLIFSGDMERLDPFTLGILCNHEVIDVDQDPLGRQARVARQDADLLILVKELEDGSKAVGLFNLGVAPATIRVDAAQLGMAGPMAVRDLWRQKDLGRFDRGYESAVRPHGVTLVRVTGAGR